MTSIFEGQHPKTRPRTSKTRGSIWVPGVFVCIIISLMITSRAVDDMTK